MKKIILKKNFKQKPFLTFFVICTEQDQIHTVNCQPLLFCAKKYGPGWVDGWVDGIMDGWMELWMGGWMDGRAGLRIAYSNQKPKPDSGVKPVLFW